MGWELSESVEGPITDRAIARLRCAAALIEVVPNLGARVFAGDTTLFEVRRPPVIKPPEHLVISPGAFRHLVLQAHEARKHDKRMMFRGELPAVAEPEIELLPHQRDQILPGPIVRCRSEGTFWHGLAIAMPRPTVRQALMGANYSVGLCLHPDFALDVTLLCKPVTGPGLDAAQKAVNVLLDAAACCGVWELIDHVNARAPSVPVFPD